VIITKQSGFAVQEVIAMKRPAVFPSSDGDIMLGAQQGDPTARDRWFDHFSPLIYGIIRGVSRRFAAGLTPDEVEDITQTVALSAFDPDRARFNPYRGSAKSYLAGLVLNAFRGVIQQRSVGRSCATGAPRAPEMSRLIDLETIPDNRSRGPQDIVIARDTVAVIWRHASRDERLIAKFRALIGESFDQLSTRVGISRCTASRRFDGLCARAGRLCG
jgi:hypothetical protein